MATRKGTVSASAAVPGIYQFIFITLEPIFALLGAVMVLHAPHQYLAGMTRNAMPYAASTRFLYTQLGGGWLFFAFTEGVVLRLFDDLNLWRVVCAGMLLSDAAYCHGTAQAVGGWEVWLDRSTWTVEDYTVFFTTAPMVLVRILIVLGIGISVPKETGERPSEKQDK
ncbi:NADP-dependent alcohol dehydrogenase-like protein [Colletotrichum higginsianum]|nr:NADP-dependent alcohol dehydrogenase-like protein [Colletotrichum higginsianum]